MDSEVARQITRRIPLPGWMIRSALSRYNSRLRFPQPGVLIESSFGGTFEIRSFSEYIQRNIYFLGYHEWRETRLFQRIVRKGDTVVDIGANLGWFTVLSAMRVGPRGRVFAFEPAADIYQHLLRHVQLNALRQVRTERLAVSDCTGEALLSGATGHNSGLGSIVRSDASANRREAIRTIRFDDYSKLADIRSVRLLKIDVEGAEMRVFRGMEKVLRERVCDYILVEVNDDVLRQDGASSRQLITMLRAAGYGLSVSVGLGWHPLTNDACPRVVNVLAARSADTKQSSR